MKKANRTIDHIVYCVKDLDRAMNEFNDLLGVAPSFGGFHTTKGTKNALLNLGNKCYLELLAVDFENTNVQGPRWMGVDILSQSQITRWSLKSNQMTEDSPVLQSYNPLMGLIENGQRQRSDQSMLRWSMSMPLSAPEIEVVPFLTDWSQSNIHPTDTLPEECQLLDIFIYHPEPDTIQPIFEQLYIQYTVLQADKAEIRIKVDCPNGIVEL